MTPEKTAELLKTESKQKAQSPSVSAEKAFGLKAEMLIVGGLGFLFGGTAFPSTFFPFGYALLASLPKYTAAAFLGLLLRMLLTGEELFWTVGGISLFYACRILLNLFVFGRNCLVRLKRLPDSLVTKYLLCAIFIFSSEFIHMVLGDITLLGMLKILIATVSAIAFTVLFTFFFDEKYRLSPVFEAGFGAIAYILTLSLMPFLVFGFSVGLAAAFLITFLVGRLGVPTRSASIGLLCGLACGGIYAPVLSLAGLVIGIFSEKYAVFSGISAALVTVLTALYFGGTADVISFLPELTVSTVAFTMLIATGLWKKDSVSFFTCQKNAKDTTALCVWHKRLASEREMKMQGLSGALDSLSCMIQGYADRFRRPDPEKLKEMIVDIRQGYCAACEGACQPSASEEALSRLVSRLLSQGKIDKDALCEMTHIRCPHAEAIAGEISTLCAALLEKAIREDKTGVFALDWEMMSQMLAENAVSEERRMPVDKALSEDLRRSFYQAGLRADQVFVCTQRKKTVIATGNAIAETALLPEDIRILCEDACGIGFGTPVFSLENGKSVMTAESLPIFTVETTVRQMPKEGECVCGDSVSYTISRDGYYYCYLCDGMGSGEEAALTSRLCNLFLEKMLGGGNKKTTTLKMLNHLLCSRSSECFATADICEIDLMTGVASFMKSGAAPSFVMRSNRLYKISSVTFPIGILPQVSAEATDFELRDGDTVILCSDGIVSDPDAADGEDSVRFLHLITQGWLDDPEKMADKILSDAVAFSARSDDMTVALLKIRRTE